MSQQINLINPSLIKKKDFFTLVNIGLIYFAGCLVLLTWYGYVYQQTAPLQTASNQADQRLQRLQQELDEMHLARQPQNNVALESEVKALEQRKQQQADLINRITNGGANAGYSVSHYMRGLARQTMESVWLTGFSITSENRALSLEGRALNADLLPYYIEKLGGETVFSGQAFGGLQVRLPEESNTVKQAEPSSEEKPTTGYVEFELKAIELDKQSKRLKASS